MKKYIAALLMLMMMLCLCSCTTLWLKIGIIDTEKSTSPGKNEPFEGYGAWGNSYLNYTDLTTSLVEYGSKVYHNYFFGCKVMVYDRLTGENTELGFNGYSLNLFNDILYYIDITNDICSYDLKTGSVSGMSCDLIASQVHKMGPETLASYRYYCDSLFVGKYGILFTYIIHPEDYKSDLPSYEYMIHMDFDGNIIKTYSFDVSGRFDQWNLLPVSERRVAAYFEHEDEDDTHGLLIYDLTTNDFSHRELDFPVYKLMTSGNGILYSKAPAEDTIYMYDINTKKTSSRQIVPIKEYYAGNIFLSSFGIIYSEANFSDPHFKDPNIMFLSFNNKKFKHVLSGYYIGRISFTSYGDMFAWLTSEYDPSSETPYAFQSKKVILSSDFKIKQILDSGD